MRRIVFLISLAYGRQASTLLRSTQLSQIVQGRLEGQGYDVACGAEDQPSDAILILSKGYLVDVSPNEIVKHQKRRNLLIADFVDWRPRPEIIELMDGLIASSHQQLAYFRTAFPSKASHLVTHNIDQRIGPIYPATDRLRVGYFGELFNARHHEELARGGSINFVQTETRAETPTWLTELPRHNCHYLLRSFQPWDGFKPFLKGFTAAHCGAPVIADPIEGDTPFYLPSDYPFYVPRPGTAAEVVHQVRKIEAAFGSPQWKYALEVMREVQARSAPQVIAREFSGMIRYHLPPVRFAGLRSSLKRAASSLFSR
ncbi:MAG: hypothetical protein ABIY37_08455 [Devosia sp.]